MNMSFNTRATQEVTPSCSCAHYEALQCTVSTFFVCELWIILWYIYIYILTGTDPAYEYQYSTLLSTNTACQHRCLFFFPCQHLLCQHLFRCLNSCYRLTRICVPTSKHRPCLVTGIDIGDDPRSRIGAPCWCCAVYVYISCSGGGTAAEVQL